MSRSRRLASCFTLLSGLLFGDDQALWKEYGLANTQTAQQGKLTATVYKMKDSTGAFAAWEWLRSAKSRPCHLASFCTTNPDQTIIFEGRDVVVLNEVNPRKSDVDALLRQLPDRGVTQLPPVLVYLPRKGLIPGSSRYIVGPASVEAFAPELKNVNLGFNFGTEGEVASYKSAGGKPVRFVILDYPTAALARRYDKAVSQALGGAVKRSGALVAAILTTASPAVAESVLDQVRYQAKLVWNEEPPKVNVIRSMYQLLTSIVYLSCILVALCFTAGLMYAGMRLYRRRYGNLESEEAMTTLHLSGD